MTDSNGVYRFPALEVGAYELAADLSGFSKASRNRHRDLARPRTGHRPHDEGAGRRGERHRRRRVAGRGRQEQRHRDDDLAVAPVQRADHAHRDQRLNYAPGVNTSSAYGGGAGSGNALLIDGVDTRDPSGGTAWTFYNYNVVEEVPVPGPRRAGGIRRLHRRGGEHDHQVGRQPVQRACSISSARNKQPRQQQRLEAIAAQNPTLADPAMTTKYVDITTQFGGPMKQNKLFFFASAQRFLLQTDPTGGVTKRHEVSPRLNFKLTWQPNPSNNFTGHVQYDAYNIIGRAGVTRADRERRPDQPGRRARVRLDDAVPAPLQLEHVLGGEVHRLVGLLRPEPEVHGVRAHRREPV